LAGPGQDTEEEVNAALERLAQEAIENGISQMEQERLRGFLRSIEPYSDFASVTTHQQTLN